MICSSDILIYEILLLTRFDISALLHFRTPRIVIDDSSWKNAAESFTVALTLTLGGYESAIVPHFADDAGLVNI